MTYPPNEAPLALPLEQNSPPTPPPKRRIWGWLVAAVLLLAFAGATLWAVLNRLYIEDWYKLSQYTAPADIAALADATGMVGRGRDMFYVSAPEINDAESFNRNCTDHGEESLVLGCYTVRRIYLYNVTDTRLAGVKEVTAAHEMLHAAYERLGEAERERVNALVDAQLQTITDERLQALIELYNEHEPGQKLNEMHSILGTEFRNLSAELEEYYRQYFSDRTKVVTFAETYESVFTESKARIAAYDQQLEQMKQQIEANYAELEVRQKELQADAARLDALRASDPTAYNQAVPAYNAQVRSFNVLVGETRSLVDQHNAVVQKRNAEVAAQSDLYKSLDSQYEPL